MRKLFYIPVLALGLLVGCAQQDTIVTLTAVNDTIASGARVTRIALEQDRISASDACRVSVYSKLASAAVDEAYLAYALGDPQGAEGHVRAAKNILAGTSAQAIAQAETECD